MNNEYLSEEAAEQYADSVLEDIDEIPSMDPDQAGDLAYEEAE